MVLQRVLLMQTETVDTLINNAIPRLHESFEENELAYLALTSKVEIPLRDRLAFRLHKDLYPHAFLVAREWKRTDLVILQNGEPLVLLQLKAMYTFDGTAVRKTPTIYPELVSDLVKIRKKAGKQSKLYLILFATHPLAVMDEGLEGIAKYRRDVNKAFRIYRTAERILETCRKTLTEFFLRKTLPVSMSGVIHAGQCFGVKVDIPFWIIGPLTSRFQMRRAV